MSKSINELDFKDYSGLNKTNEYDRKKAELLAEAMTERNTLVKRVAFLEDLLIENSDLKPFLWTTLEGVVKPLHKIDDDHLKNIMTHILNRGGTINAQIKAEAKSRGFTIPTADPRRLAIEAEIIDHDDFYPEWDD